MANPVGPRTRKTAIVVTGDVAVDWFEATFPPEATPGSDPNAAPEWQSCPSFVRFARPGGAWLLADLVRAACGMDVAAPSDDGAERIPSSKIVHSFAVLDAFPHTTGMKDDRRTVYRVRRQAGLRGPSDARPSALPLKAPVKDPSLILLDDGGNGFANHEDLWPSDLPDRIPAIVVLKTVRPLAAGRLLDAVLKLKGGRTVLVVDADDLRREGIKISRRLSWERTAKELAWQLASNPALRELGRAGRLIVRFGLEGALVYARARGRVMTHLFYDPTNGEDGFGERHPGAMPGAGSAFLAGLAARLAVGGLEDLDEGIRRGLVATRRFHLRGFGTDPRRAGDPAAGLFADPEAADGLIADIQVPPPAAAEPADPGFWCILDDLARADLETIAYNFVRTGRDARLDRVPSGRFRDLLTYDRSEIESYRSLKNLIGEYLANPAVTRPLSIAVFGAPGSGKSFGVNEVAESVAPGRLKKIEFNVSQFASRDELVAALHKVRDVSLGGKVPLVFFDEFDSALDGPLGWLKSFLAPMQDGLFSDGRDLHPIGRSVFVFAGGTCATFRDFARGEADAAFREAKGPDFVSRLRGYVNIKGPNPVDDGDRFFMVRRAQVLRFQLAKSAPWIFGPDGICRVDPGILRALVKVPVYRHGIRSMLSVIEMSLLTGRSSFEQAALPSPDQLDLHVDAAAFSKLVVRDVLLGSAREALAAAIHEKYRKDHKAAHLPDDPSLVPYEELSEDLKESNRRQADDIPRKLRAVGCDFAPASGKKAPSVTFSREGIETMARMEHDRYVAERLLQGFTPGPRDAAKKSSPYLVGWEELKEEVREIDRNAVRIIPDLLASAGFEIYRLVD